MGVCSRFRRSMRIAAIKDLTIEVRHSTLRAVESEREGCVIAIATWNGEWDRQFEKLDLTSVRFPSDSLSIKAIRDVHPELFDKGFGKGEQSQPKFFLLSGWGGHSEDMLGGMLYCERLIAVCAFAKARGLHAPQFNVDDFKDELIELYTKYGLASGRHHAGELIRNIEQQGAQLGKEKQP